MDFIIALITGFIALVAIVLAMDYYHKWQRARKANTELVERFIEQREVDKERIEELESKVDNLGECLKFWLKRYGYNQLEDDN